MLLVWILAWCGGVSGLKAQVIVEPAQLDLGVKKQDEVVEQRLTLTNRGTKPVQLLQVRADCGCTSAQWEKSILEPGEATGLAVRFETRQVNGPLRRQITLETSAGEVTIPLQVEVSPYAHWRLAPMPLALATSAKGETIAAEIRVKRLTGEGKVVAVASPKPWLQVTVEEEPGGGEFRLHVAKAAGAPLGNHWLELQAQTTDAIEPVLRLPVYVPVVSAIKAFPSPLVVKAVLGVPVKATIWLKGWKGAPVPAVHLKSGTAQWVETTEEGARYELTVTPSQAGTSTQMVSFELEGETVAEVAMIVRVSAP